jgi:ligand-binding sensor domain-containing protein
LVDETDVLRRVRIPTVRFAAIFLCLALEGTVRAQQYSFRYFGVEDGLTNLAVKVLFQDRTGFLWAGTESGIFRYDGQRFQRYGTAEGLPPEVVLSLGEAPDGSVLAGYRTGLYRQSADGFKKVPLPGAGVIDSYSAIQFDGHDRTYIGTTSGLAVAVSPAGETSLVLWLHAAMPGRADAGGAHGVFLEPGVVWYGCGVALCRVTGERITVFGDEEGLPKGRWMSIRRDARGDLWLHDLKRFAVMPRGGMRFQTFDPGFPQTAGGGQLEVDARGRLLIPTIEGLTISDRHHIRTIGKRENLRPPVYAVLRDREGSIWLGLADHDLARWRGHGEWEGFGSESGLDSELIYAILPLENRNVLVGTEDGLYRGRKTGDRWTWERSPQVGRVPVHALRAEPGGSLWLGTERKGAARIDFRSGRIDWFGPKQGPEGMSPFALTLDRSGRVGRQPSKAYS